MNTDDILIQNQYCPGDSVILTGVVRDFVKAYGKYYRVGVLDRIPQVWENNPYLTPVNELLSPKIVKAGYNIFGCDNTPKHLLQLWAENLTEQLEIPYGFPITLFKGDLHLSQKEKSRPTELVGEGKYWVVMAGSKMDCQTKQWPFPYFQEVVNTFQGQIRFVQCGQTGEGQRQEHLSGVTDLIGQTDIRTFLRVIQWSEGVLCPITFAMHSAAALPGREDSPPVKPCVVVAGGREPPHFFSYPGHTILHRSGMMPCNATGSCWKSDLRYLTSPHRGRSDLCLEPSNQVRGWHARCMEIIKPAEVTRAIQGYYDGGILTF